MTISESLYFMYDGKKSSDFGIKNVHTSKGLFEENFLADREINETTVRGREKPYFFDVQYSPISIPLTFAFEETWDSDKIREVARWLRQPYYKELYFSEHPSRRFFAMYTGNVRLLHNGLKQGYIELEMRCDSPYSYSPEYVDIYNDLTATSEITFESYGDEDCKPELWISKVGIGNVSIVNTSDGNREFKFTNLEDGEEVYIDNENEHIESSKNVYRHDNFNQNYLELPRGVNKLTIEGDCHLKFRYRFKTLQ